MFGSSRRFFGMFSLTCAAGAIGAAALPISAQASVVSLSACDNSSLSQPFTPWADFSQYKLAPGADFEGSLSGWSLQGGAAQASGSESYGVTGSAGSSSLSVPAGGVATSPVTCVNAAYPDFRLFTRTDTPGSSVSVTVVYNEPTAGTVTIPVGVITPTSDWQLSVPMLTTSAIPGLTNGGNANIALQFTGVTGSVQVDDVYVDPWGRCC